MIASNLRAIGSKGLLLLDTITGVLLLALTFLTLFDVAGRNLLRSPVPGATELTELMLAVLIFLTFPRLAWKSGHIVVDLLDPLIGPLGRKVQRKLSGVLCASVFLGLVWPITRLGLRALENQDGTIQLGIPLGPFLLLMAVFCGITSCAFLAVTLDTSLPEQGE